MSSVLTANMATSDQLVKGFYPVEQGAWRWTAKDFAIALAVPKSPHPMLNLDAAVPQVLLDQVGGSTTLHARMGTSELAPQTFNSAGNFTYQHELPEESRCGRGAGRLLSRQDCPPEGAAIRGFWGWSSSVRPSNKAAGTIHARRCVPLISVLIQLHFCAWSPRRCGGSEPVLHPQWWAAWIAALPFARDR